MLKGLIIDDSEMARRIIGKSLEGVGVDFEYACDGQEAIDILSKKSFDFIITDLSMPVLDGERLLELIRAEDRTTPVYIMTSKEIVDIEEDLFLKGGNAVFNKMDIQQFAGFVREKVSTAMKVTD